MAVPNQQRQQVQYVNETEDGRRERLQREKLENSRSRSIGGVHRGSQERKEERRLPRRIARVKKLSPESKGDSGRNALCFCESDHSQDTPIIPPIVNPFFDAAMVTHHETQT